MTLMPISNAPLVKDVANNLTDLKPIHELFEKQAAKTPQLIAICDNNQQLTYQQLDQLANSWACFLIDQGIKPGDVVGLAIERTVKVVAGLLAILKTGAAYLPLDTSLPSSRLEYMVKDAQITRILSQHSLKDKACFENIENIYIEDIPQSNTTHTVNVSLDDLAIVIYTSGSTGNPKVHILPHHEHPFRNKVNTYSETS